MFWPRASLHPEIVNSPWEGVEEPILGLAQFAISVPDPKAQQFAQASERIHLNDRSPPQTFVLE